MGDPSFYPAKKTCARCEVDIPANTSFCAKCAEIIEKSDAPAVSNLNAYEPNRHQRRKANAQKRGK